MFSQMTFRSKTCLHLCFQCVCGQQPDTGGMCKWALQIIRYVVLATFLIGNAHFSPFNQYLKDYIKSGHTTLNMILLLRSQGHTHKQPLYMFYGDFPWWFFILWKLYILSLTLPLNTILTENFLHFYFVKNIIQFDLQAVFLMGTSQSMFFQNHTHTNTP